MTIILINETGAVMVPYKVVPQNLSVRNEENHGSPESD